VTVLVVEDQPEWQRVFLTILHDIGCPCDVVGSSAEAMAKLRQESFKLAIIDVRLTDWDPDDIGGLDLIDWLAENAAETRVIVVTAYADVEVARRSFKSGIVVDFFHKARFSHLEFVELVRQVVTSNL